MFDFVNYTFSGLMSIFGAIMGLAYPIILQSIQRIDEQYNSIRLAALFQQESIFKLFQGILFSNIIISIISPFALYLDSVAITIGVLLLQTTFVSALLFTSFSLFNLIRTYYDPNKLFNRLESSYEKGLKRMMIDLKKSDSPKLIKDLQGVFDISVYGARRSDPDTYQKALSGFYFVVYEYQRKCENSQPVVYPKGFMKIFDEIKYHSTNSKEQTFFYFQNSITSVLYTSIPKHRISEETYRYIWRAINEVVNANNEDWFNQYWSLADQYYNLVLSPMMHEEHNATDSEDRDRFYELHIMVGALLVYDKKFDWLNNMMFFTNQIPPKYKLIPSTLRQVFEQIKYFNNYVSPISIRFISAKYSFRGMNADVNTDYYIYNEIKSYLALLVIRLFLVNDYNITYSDPMELPDSGGDIDENEHYHTLMQSLIFNVELWYKTGNIEKVQLSKIPLKSDVLALLNSYIERCKEAIKQIEEHPCIDIGKIKTIKDKLQNVEMRFKKRIITKEFIQIKDHILEVNDYEIKEWILPYSYKMEASEILEGYRSASVNLEDVLLQILYDAINRNYLFQFMSVNSLVDYSVAYSDVLKAFSALELDASKHVILSLGTSLENYENMYGEQEGFIYDLEKGEMSYKEVPIIRLVSNERAFLILNIADVPYYEFQEINDPGYERLGSDSYLYSNLDTLDINDLILRLKYSLKYSYKHTFEYVKIKISYNLPLGSSGDLDSIKPF